MTRSWAGQILQNYLRCDCSFLQHIIIPKTRDAVTHRLQRLRATIVARRLFAVPVAVRRYNQPAPQSSSEWEIRPAALLEDDLFCRTPQIVR